MNLSDNQKRMLGLLLLGPDTAPADSTRAVAWWRLMGKLCALGYVEPVTNKTTTFQLTCAGAWAARHRQTEAHIMAETCGRLAHAATNTADRGRFQRSEQGWYDEWKLLGGKS